MNIEKLKFPIGKYQEPETITDMHILKWITDLEVFPTKLENLVSNLIKEQLELTYRPNGWTIRQVVHHCADSHINSLMRYKLTLTEDNPTIKPYLENVWANLADYQDDITSSIQILKGVHYKLVSIIKNASNTDLNKTFYHPENNTTINLKQQTGIYAWHSNHHLAHIMLALNP